MEENKKLYSQKAIGIATYFGGPLAAGYLVKKNYQSLDQDDNGKRAFLIGIVSSLLLFSGMFLIPDNVLDKLPNALIPLIYTGIIYLIVERIQGEELKLHKENNGDFQSAWKAAGIGVISLVIIGVGAFIVGDLSKVEPDFDLTSYNKGLSEFSENESKSLQVFSLPPSSKSEKLIKGFGKGVVLWKDNISILNEANQILNLPQDLKIQNGKLIEYCKLRIVQFENGIKAISEKTDKYDVETQEVIKKIDLIVESLK